MEERELRTGSLIGEAGIARLKACTVAVFGIGGVGSYAVEALARSGIGTLYLYDHDTVSESNRNRQLIALGSTVGQYKTAVAAARCRDIDPAIKIMENPVFITPETPLPFERFDFMIDAVDNVTAKLFLAEAAQRYGIPSVSVMGTGNKLDPTRLAVGDISETRECPLARVMRSELKKRGITRLKAVWSPEKPISPADVGERRATGRVSPGSMVFVPGCAGLIAAAEAVRTLLGSK